MKWLIAILVLIGAYLLATLIAFSIIFGVIFIGNSACEWFMGTELLTTAQIGVVSVIVTLIRFLFFDHKKEE